MKKVLSLLMVLAVVLSLFSATTVFANDNTVVVDGVTFSKNMKILVKYSVDKTDESYTIPNSVTTIENGAFANNKFIKSVNIPKSITIISDSVFSECTNLETVVLPETITTICYDAFNNCTNLKNISIPNNVTSIGALSFNGCSNLESIVIPSQITSLYGGEFSNCTSLKSVVLSENLISLGNGAFSGCTELKNITFLGDYTNLDWSAFSGCISIENIEIPSYSSEIGDCVFRGCTSLKSITIPESVTQIDDNAFDGCTSLTDVYYGATEIEWNAIDIGTGNGFLQTANIHFTEPDTSEIKVTVNGKKLVLEQPPVIENGRTLVPLRAIFEALNAEVAWDGETKTVRAIRYGTYIELQIGSNEMKVNNEIITLDVPAKTINERTMVPARAVAEAFGCNVSWDAENNAVIIN